MATAANPTRDDFAKMLDEQLGGADDGGFEGRVVKGTVTAIENGMAHIDVGLKSEGRVDLKEFQRSESETAPGVGDEVEVYVDRVENAGLFWHLVDLVWIFLLVFRDIYRRDMNDENSLH